MTKHWAAFVDAVKPLWARDDLATLAQRAKHIDPVYGLLPETFFERTTREWLDLLRALHVSAAPLNSTDSLFDNAHLNEAGFFETIDSPYGKIRFPGLPCWFSRTPGEVAGPAPTLGEHTEDVLAALGLDHG